MKIVVLDGYTLNPGDISWEGLEKFGQLKVNDRISYDEKDEDLIVEAVGDAEIVFTNKTPMTRTAIQRMPNLKYIGVLATGYNVVDIETAKERGIVVTNIPTYGTASVGQFAIAMLLEICHNIGHHSKAVHEGRWETNPDWCFWDYPLIELDGKTMGIIGYGRIGQTTGRIAQALGMKVLAYDEYKNPDLVSDITNTMPKPAIIYGIDCFNREINVEDLISCPFVTIASPRIKTKIINTGTKLPHLIFLIISSPQLSRSLSGLRFFLQYLLSAHSS
jgi:lactate dehydrogenase-like 2-hydroxyacid dehydrogenase